MQITITYRVFMEATLSPRAKLQGNEALRNFQNMAEYMHYTN